MAKKARRSLFVPEGMTRKERVEQLAALRERAQEFISEDLGYEELYNLLLSFGGEAVVPSPEPDLGRLLEHGHLREGMKVRMAPGQPIRCHSNSACLWDTNPTRFEIVTGYGLSDDGLWRQHTWVEERAAGIIWETTKKRSLYFGFDLSPKEAARFYEENVY